MTARDHLPGAQFEDDSATSAVNAHDVMLEALELVALTPATRGVYVLDEQDMKQVRAAIARATRRRLADAPADGAQLRKMVDRFLCWKLPRTFSPDAGIKFEPSNGMSREEAYAKVGWWPVGTNLLTADEARAMLEHLFDKDAS